MTGTELVLRALTPVHIGGTEELHAGQYTIWGNRLYVFSEERLLNLLLQRRLANRFLGDAVGIMNSRDGRGMRSWLEQHQLWSESIIADISVYSCKLSGGRPTTKDIRVLTRSAQGNPQFFGTAIKGSLRTVILYHVAKQWIRERPTEFLKMVDTALQRVPGNKKWASQPMVEELLASHLIGKGPEISTRDSKKGNASDAPHRDYLRVLRIGDAAPFAKDAASIVSTSVKSVGGENGWYDKAPITIETVDVGQQTRLKIVLDDWLMGQYVPEGMPMPFTTVADIEKYVTDFHTDWIANEIRFYDYVKKPIPTVLLQTQGKPILHLGWGSGLTGTTVLMLLPEEYRLRIRDKFFIHRDMSVFPKSRRLGPEDSPLGLVELTFTTLSSAASALI
ncbi:type III-A CRISPR-associated RAMP protein Csm5 [Alicyclobacillaceae bacterium I2511]|nr:type III-A CRISPR-associated RAMP protein Csm5 [Alicyclobacillaceae bacterium I2511]